MGIKGIYKEIGSGTRISLTKLAVAQLEDSARPLRVAIDISIWQFQVQAAQGGSNPAVRTLFYRLLRLLGLSIHPIFVFDGPNKPKFKRNKRSGRGNGVATSMAKRMIRLFGFQVHDAPGEAEAECALLQQQGIVDAVLSEDVDTIMFGCTRTLRNWSAEGAKGSKAPTHVSMYDTEGLLRGGSGLDREGMVLVALMSGGDYIPEGIPGAGVKLACEAARAGFGKSLCRLKKSDVAGMDAWRRNLIHELRTNESRFFRTKHVTLVVPGDFPSIEVLRYYTHPIVSPASVLDRLRTQPWGKSLDILGLRDFVRETFDWEYRGGAIKFIRVLAPCLLVRKLMDLSAQHIIQSPGIGNLEEEQAGLVIAIRNRRAHCSTDATPELRISFKPTDIVGYNFEQEPEEEILCDRDGLALNSEDEGEAAEDEDGAGGKTPKKPFDPTEADLSWIPETIAKLGIPLMVEDWEAAQRAKASRQKVKAPARQKAQKTKLGGMTAGALDRYVKVTKSLQADSVAATDSWMEKPASPALPGVPSSQPDLFRGEASPKVRPPSRPTARKQSKSWLTTAAPPPDPTKTPWTIASSSPRASQKKHSVPSQAVEAILISSSPPGPAAPIGVRRSTAHDAGKRDAKAAASPQKRRSTTPLEEATRRFGSGSRDVSPTPQSGAVGSRRKLARTESMPVGRGTPGVTRGGAGAARSPRGRLSRSRTAVVEPPAFDSDDDGSDGDLPSLDALCSRRPSPLAPAPAVSASAPLSVPRPPAGTNLPAPKSRAVETAATSRRGKLGLDKPNAATSTSTSTSRTKATSAAASRKPGKLQRQEQQQQARLSDVFSMRTTKLYTKTKPGCYDEIEVTVEEAERLGRDKSRTQWRQSDVSVLDLTGED